MKPLIKMYFHQSYIIPVLWMMFFGLSACQKEGGSCFTNTGKIIRQDRQLSDFDSISLNDYVNLILTQDTMNLVSVEAGQNIVDGITTTVIDRQLVIHNRNECNWLRSYTKPINVYVTVKNLWKVNYNSSGNLTTTNAIASDIFIVDAWGGCGSIDIELKIHEGFFIQHMGTADFKLRGVCGINSVYAGDFGLFDCGDLQTGYTFIKNYGSNDCYVQASMFLDATIGSIGNIYYKGNPDTLYTHIFGSGEILPF